MECGFIMCTSVMFAMDKSLSVIIDHTSKTLYTQIGSGLSIM